nr:MAG TPA: hypothetical protein [Bacteriophage sp.]
MFTNGLARSTRLAMRGSWVRTMVSCSPAIRTTRSAPYVPCTHSKNYR